MLRSALSGFNHRVKGHNMQTHSGAGRPLFVWVGSEPKIRAYRLTGWLVNCYGEARISHLDCWHAMKRNQLLFI